jgi:general secretion pathway protein A
MPAPSALYAAHFGLGRDPFSIAPDPHFLFMSERHREALAHLLFGLEAGGGLVVVTGDIGAGKTTVCRCFLEQLPAHCSAAYIFNPKLDALELLESICAEFGVAVLAPHGGRPTLRDNIEALNRHLLARHASGHNSVLIIDEAQNLAPDVLEQLRLLTNLETTERKLLQIILIGQPELRDVLARPDMEQLAQRVMARYHLGPLGDAETAHYVDFRLRVAGLTGPLPLSAKALRQLHRRTRGVPRRINVVAGRSLLMAYASHRHEVTPAMVDQAAAEVLDTAAFAARTGATGLGRLGLGGLHPLALATGLLLVAGVASLAVWMGRPHDAAAPRLDQTPSTLLPAPALRGPPMAMAPTPTSAPPDAPRSALLPAHLWTSEPAGWLALSRLTQAGGTPASEGLMAQTTSATAAHTCTQLAHEQRQVCLRVTRMSWPLLLQLQRPALLQLNHAAGGVSGWLVVVAATSQTVTILTPDGTRLVLSAAALAGHWRGEYASLWTLPPGLNPSGRVPGATGPWPTPWPAPLRDWLAQRLPAQPALPQAADSASATAITAPAAVALTQRLQAFQMANGLAPDGKAGPLTLMLLAQRAP